VRQMPTPPPDLYSQKDLATRLGFSDRQIRRMNSAGLIPSPVMIGSSPRWTRADIDSWLNSGCPKRDAGKSTTQSV